MECSIIANKIRIMILIIMLGITSYSFSDTLNVGVPIVGSPVAEKINTGQGSYYFGFCIDIMNSICTHLDKTCVYHQINFENQLALLNNGKIDVLLLPQPYQSNTFKHYAASIPYVVSKAQFITLKNSNINEMIDIKNKKIGVVKSTFYDLLMHSEYAKENQILAYDSNPTLLSNLAQNKVDVIVLNNAVAYNLINHNPNYFKQIGHSIPLGNGYGIIAPAGKEALIEKINNAIIEIQQDGTYESIYQKYYTDVMQSGG